MTVYRVWSKDVADCAWLDVESEVDAIEIVSKLRLFVGPLKAEVDDRKLSVPKGVVVDKAGITTTIIKS